MNRLTTLEDMEPTLIRRINKRPVKLTTNNLKPFQTTRKASRTTTSFSTTETQVCSIRSHIGLKMDKYSVYSSKTLSNLRQKVNIRVLFNCSKTSTVKTLTLDSLIRIEAI